MKQTKAKKRKHNTKKSLADVGHILNHYPRHKVYPVMSLGAGIQSTAMLLMEIEGLLPKSEGAIFADTKWEPAQVYTHLKKLQAYAKKNDYDIHVISKVDLREKTVQNVLEVGFMTIPFFVLDLENPEKKGMRHRICTREAKIDPINSKVRELLGYKPKQRVKHQVEMRLGITTDEASRMATNRVTWITNAYPLIDLGYSRQDCEKYLIDKGWDVPRSARVICPYKSNQEWLQLKQDCPENFREAVEIDEFIRNHNSGRYKIYLHSSCVPLKDIDFEANAEEDDGLNFFNAECQGICGV